MKKLAIVMILMLCMVLSLSLAACNNSGELPVPANVGNTDNSGEKTNTLYWDEVKNASGYIVELDGDVLKETTNTFYTYVTDDEIEHTMRVKAKGSGKFTDSAFSELFTFRVKAQLKAPEIKKEIEGDNIRLSWNAIEGAKGYEVQIGLNLNETDPLIVSDNFILIDIKNDVAYNGIGEYKMRVRAVSGDEKYADSNWSGQLSYINSLQVETPASFVCDNGIFKWASTDANASKFVLEAVSVANPEKVFTKETSSKQLELSYLDIDESGDYNVTVMAYNNGDRRVYTDSNKTEPITITILPKVSNVSLSGSVLSWDKVDKAEGYKIRATTNKNTYFDIPVEAGVTSYDMKDSVEFKKYNNVAKMFTFNVTALGKGENKLFNSTEATSLPAGNYYQYIPVESDYNNEANQAVLAGDKDRVFPKKIEDKDLGTYYSVETYPELIWALINAGDVTIRLANDIDISGTEFVTPVKSFGGTFDGNNHAINGIIMTNAFKRNDISIFGDLTATANIHDLIVNNVNIEISDKNINSGILASTNRGSIKGVVVAGSVTMLDGSNNIGGFVYDNKATIDSAFARVNIQSKWSAGVAVLNNGTINDTTVMGDIKGYSLNDEVVAGGVVAKNSGTITYVISNASVLVNAVDNATLGIVGGVVGINEGNISYSYFTSSVTSNCMNLSETFASYEGGFVGYNKKAGVITLSYVDSMGSLKRQDTTPLAGGFVGKNEGNISNAYSNIQIPDSFNNNKAAFVADNTNGTIKNTTYNKITSGQAPAYLAGMKGNYDETLNEGYYFKDEGLTNAMAKLGSEFVIYNKVDESTGKVEYIYNRGLPVLKDVIYVFPIYSSDVPRDFDLASRGDQFKVYYFNGEKKTVAGEMRTNKYPGYQIISYKDKVGDKEVVFSRLIRVK